MERHRIKQATQDFLACFDSVEHAAATCGISKAKLERSQDHDVDEYLTLNAVVLLERTAGQPAVSSTLAALQKANWIAPRGDTVSEALDLSPAVGELLSFIKEATRRDSPEGIHFSEDEKRHYHEIRAKLEKELRDVNMAVDKNSRLPFPAL